MGWEGLYEVSSDGQVRSTRRRGTRGGILSPGLDNDGYRKVRLCRDSVHTPFKIATLVAAAFLGLRPDGHVVRHQDGNEQNDVAANLVYGTQGENISDQVRHGTHANARKECCPKCQGPYSVQKNGLRFCRPCTRANARARQRRYRQRKKLGVTADRTLR